MFCYISKIDFQCSYRATWYSTFLICTLFNDSMSMLLFVHFTWWNEKRYEIENLHKWRHAEREGCNCENAWKLFLLRRKYWREIKARATRKTWQCFPLYRNKSTDLLEINWLLSTWWETLVINGLKSIPRIMKFICVAKYHNSCFYRIPEKMFVILQT